MVTRAEKERRAKEIISEQPQAGRRVIAKILRQEFGKGLRDAVILSLQREKYPEKARLIIAPYQLAKPLEARYRPLRRGRYNWLVKHNFSSEEARALSTLPRTRLKFMKEMAKARKEIIAKLQKEGRSVGWSKMQFEMELKQFLDFTYKDSGWTDLAGYNNPFSMLRQYRREAIDAGVWDPTDSPWRRKPWTRLKMSRWKGDTRGQHRRWRGLHKDSIKQAKQTYKQRQREKVRRGS